MGEKDNNNRRVHFLPENNTVFEIESCKDFTKQEIRDGWYTAAWLQKVGEKRSIIASEWEADKPSGLYMRGLEQYTREGDERVTRTVGQCIDAVMDEQDVQWCIGEDDFERFAAVSQEVSTSSVALALQRAKFDELEAQRIYQQQPKIKKSRIPLTKQSVAKPIVDDDHTANTSVCSDLTQSENDSGDCSCVPMQNGFECEQCEQIHISSVTKEFNKQGGTNSVRLRHVLVKALRRKMTRKHSLKISQTYQMIHA